MGGTTAERCTELKEASQQVCSLLGDSSPPCKSSGAALNSACQHSTARKLLASEATLDDSPALVGESVQSVASAKYSAKQAEAWDPANPVYPKTASPTANHAKPKGAKKAEQQAREEVVAAAKKIKDEVKEPSKGKTRAKKKL